MNLKLVGGVLLIVGTSIGGGMLALPLSAAPGGLLSSSLMLLACWAVMTFCAFLILEVNLWLPADSNLVSMARTTLGKIGASVMWFVYLLLLYCLLAVYTSGGADMVRHVLETIGLTFPTSINALIYVGVLGAVVSFGIYFVDYVNRAFMLTKFLAFFILVGFLAFYLKPEKLLGSEQPLQLIASLTIMLTAFGFAIIVPSLRSYFNSDIKKIRLAILIGSLIPLLFYFVWNLLILGIVPRDGHHGLLPMLTSGRATTDLPTALSHYLNNDWIAILSRVFAVMAVATSFLGVALSTSDFLADGLKIRKKGVGNLIIYSVTFIPPLAVSIFYPNAFIQGLRYAGICCAILLILLPALMAWRGRYHIGFSIKSYRVWGGKCALMVVLLMGILVGILGWLQDVQGLTLFG